jgi:hypothetical protein
MAHAENKQVTVLFADVVHEGGYREFRERYRTMAKSLNFEGHMHWAEAVERT